MTGQTNSVPVAVQPLAALPTYTIHPYHDQMVAEILALVDQSLGSTVVTPKTPAFWQWKHHANPFGASYGLYAWDDAQEIAIGVRVLMHWQFCSADHHGWNAVRAVDTASHPAYQRLGIFSKLTRQAIAELTQMGIHFIYNTPNSKSLPGYLKMGWQIVAHWPLYVKLLRPWRMAICHLRTQPEAGTLSFADYFGPSLLTWSAFRQQYEAEACKLLAAWEMQRCGVGLRTPRTLDYLAWRYGQHPTVQYGVYVTTEPSGELSGFAILRPNLRYGWREVVLTELCLPSTAVATGAHFLQGMARQIRGDYLIAHFADQTLERQMLRQSGFFRLPHQGMVFTVRPLQTGLEQLYQPTAWDLTLGDLEIF